MCFGALQQNQSFLSDILRSLTELYEDNLFLTIFYEFLGLESNIGESPNSVPVPKVIKEGITFERVGFCYLAQEKKSSKMSTCI